MRCLHAKLTSLPRDLFVSVVQARPPAGTLHLRPARRCLPLPCPCHRSGLPLQLDYPAPYTTCVQELECGSWVFPSADGSWLCAKRAASAAAGEAQA